MQWITHIVGGMCKKTGEVSVLCNENINKWWFVGNMRWQPRILMGIKPCMFSVFSLFIPHSVAFGCLFSVLYLAERLAKRVVCTPSRRRKP